MSRTSGRRQTDSAPRRAPALPFIMLSADIDTYGLRESEIVRKFDIVDPSYLSAVPELAAWMSAARAFAYEYDQHFAIVRWPNGIEALAMYDASEAYPSAAQLLRAYKSACAVRMLADYAEAGSST